MSPVPIFARATARSQAGARGRMSTDGGPSTPMFLFTTRPGCGRMACTSGQTGLRQPRGDCVVSYIRTRSFGTVRPCVAPTRDGSEIRVVYFDLYPVHAITRKSLGDMTRKLSVTESHRFAQLRGTVSRRKPSVASANWVHVA